MNSENGNAQAEDSPASGTTRHCFVLCRGAEPASADPNPIVHGILGSEFSALQADENVIAISRGEEAIGFLAHMPIPIPGDEVANHADGNMLWPGGMEEATQHRSHVIVTNLGTGDQSAVESALGVTRLALVALELFDGLGVYWGNASVCNSRDAFEEICQNASEELLPIPMWLRFQLVQADNGLGIYTLGMEQFDLMDVEVDSCQWDVSDLFDFVNNIAHYLISSGPVIDDGHTVGGSEEERILVRHLPSMIDQNRNVYKIVFD